MAKKYDESAIQTLDALSHIRKRTGMYIGRLGDGSHYDDGIYILIKEVVDNSVDELIMGHGSTIEIKLEPATQKICVRDYGRGIPLGKVIDCVSKINTGAKYNSDVFQFSVGLNGVGTKAVNALSKEFIVRSYREQECMEAVFSQGQLISQKKGKTKEVNGTYIEFIPDPEIFKKFKFNDEFIIKRLWNYAYLNQNLLIDYNGLKIQSEHGLLDLLNSEVQDEQLYPPLHFRSKKLEFALLHTQSYGESYFSFVNGQYTSDGGTHLSAFREGILKGINQYAKRNFQGVDLRDGILAAVLVRLEEPIFESQTKNKLANTEIRGPLVQEVKDAFVDLLYKNQESAKKIIDRISFNEKLRVELAEVKKEAKERQKKISFKIPKLRDSKYHYTDTHEKRTETMIFITEGDSASASIVATRDPLVQAVFSLRGKPLNVHGLKRDQLYKNDEMFNLMNALDLEEDIDNLRYNKIIIATDADIDGMHIRNLLITYFLTYFEGIALNGHLFILETPIFKLRTKEQTYYCFSEEEKDNVLKTINQKSVEITRFKGLGEISPKEFGQFIGKNMRLQQVVISNFKDIKASLEFYMGKNTPERKQFIMDNLVTELEML